LLAPNSSISARTASYGAISSASARTPLAHPRLGKVEMPSRCAVDGHRDRTEEALSHATHEADAIAADALYRGLVMPRRAEPEASLEIGNGFSNLECMLWICSAGYKSEGSENRSDQTPRLGRAVGATARFAPGSPRGSDRRSEPRKSPQALSSCRCGTFKRIPNWRSPQLRRKSTERTSRPPFRAAAVHRFAIETLKTLGFSASLCRTENDGLGCAGECTRIRTSDPLVEGQPLKLEQTTCPITW